MKKLVGAKLIKVDGERKLVYETFPKIYKNKNGLLTVVYSNRVESYNLKIKESYKEITEDNNQEEMHTADHEIEMLTGNGFSEIHYNELNIED